MPTICSRDCAAVYLPFYEQCAVFLHANQPRQATVADAVASLCQHPAAPALAPSCDAAAAASPMGQCAAASLEALERRLSQIPVTWWQGDGSIYIGSQQTALSFAPCTPIYLYDAGVTSTPIDCLNGLLGTSEIELEPDHDYPLSPIRGCPPNPTSGPGGGWAENAPTNGQHYFSNVLSGDSGGYNSWAIDDNTADGGQFQTFTKQLNPARVREAFEMGWVMRARARLMSCTTVSAYLFAFQGGPAGSSAGDSSGFRYLPYICDDDTTQIGDPAQRNSGGIAVGEYNRPGATLPRDRFPPDQYHLYELVYDPKAAQDANVAEHGIDCSRCTATLYVDGENMGPYYPYAFEESAIAAPGPATVSWGSGADATV